MPRNLSQEKDVAQDGAAVRHDRGHVHSSQPSVSIDILMADDGGGGWRLSLSLVISWRGKEQEHMKNAQLVHALHPWSCTQRVSGWP